MAVWVEAAELAAPSLLEEASFAGGPNLGFWEGEAPFL